MNQKIKIMNRHPQVSDEEVKGYMDFDKLLHHHNKALHKRNLFVRYGTLLFTVAVLITAYFFVQPRSSESDQRSAIADTASIADTPTEKESVRPAQTEVTDEPVPVQTDTAANRAAQPKASPTKPRAEENQPDGDANRSTSATKIEENTVANTKPKAESRQESVYVQAEPLHGYDNLFSYFREKLKYPDDALKDSVQGVLTISFVITSDGKPDHITIEKSLGEPFEKEAIKLIEGMPLWKPATLNSKPVSSKVTLPLTFEIRKANR